MPAAPRPIVLVGPGIEPLDELRTPLQPTPEIDHEHIRASSDTAHRS